MTRKKLVLIFETDAKWAFVVGIGKRWELSIEAKSLTMLVAFV
jgi:hypothetical protein